MKNTSTIKKIIIGLVIAIVLLIAYAALNGGGAPSGVSTSSLTSINGIGSLGQVKESDTQIANAEILRILGSIQNIELNDDIFVNPVFKELVDTRFTIPKPTRIGRPNPFLPIGFDFGTQDLTGSSLIEDIDAGDFSQILSGEGDAGASIEPTDFFNEAANQ